MKVFFREDTQTWTVSDFGLYSEGTSKSFLTTEPIRRGPVYDSPETLGNNRVYDTKADIWALGCILYELVERKPAFPHSTAVMTAFNQIQLTLGPGQLDPRGQCIATELIKAMLEVDMWKRPETTHILPIIVSIVRWDRTLVWVNCKHRTGRNGAVNALLNPSTSTMWGNIRWSQSWYKYF